jgi:hypothetical protein
MSRRSGAAASGEDAPAPAVRRRSVANSPARRPSSSAAASGSHKKKQPSTDATTPQRGRPAQRTSAVEGSDEPAAAARSASPYGTAYIAESLLATADVKPTRPPPATTTNPQGSWVRNNNTEDEVDGANSGHPYARMRHAADLGKMQLGFHNDQYIEDISVESVHSPTAQHNSSDGLQTLTLRFCVCLRVCSSLRFLYKPHTVTALLIIVGVLLFLAFRTDLHNPNDWVSNLRVGVGAAAFFVLVLGMLIFPSGPFIRPHPVVWRVAFGVAVLYEMWLIILLFQSKDHARKSMQFFDSSLGVPVSERSYAANCALTWENVKGNLDVFVASHFLGWVVKALILRDALLCWIISIQWELIEILFMHMLPNFAECWWDQWILDVGVSNALGIVIGCKLAGYLEMKEYKWGSYGSIPSYLGKAKRTMMQFTPASWTKVEWKPTSSLKRVFAVQVLIVCMHIEELNAFFLKYILWVPPECKLNCTNKIHARTLSYTQARSVAAAARVLASN